MKIVMIGPFAFQPKGTVSARAFLMARALVKRAHQATILMPPYDNLQDSGQAWQKDGVQLENMALRRNDMWHQLTVPALMARRALSLQADVIHVFKPIGYSGLAGLYLSLFSRTPLVLDSDDWEGRGGWSDVNPYPNMWRRFFDWQEHWLARHVRAVTVASRTLQDQMWGFGIEPARVVYLPNGPDESLRAQADVEDDQKAAVRARLGVGDAPLALYLGHIPTGSDMDLALEAFARLASALPEARLVVAGVGDGLSDLKARAVQLGLRRTVVFPGWIERDEAHLYLAAADVIVNPYRDSLVNRAKCAGKVVAAMAMGKAVVTSRLGENLEYIEHGRSGLLTEPEDAQELAGALLTLLSDRDLALDLGRNARERIWRKFDWDMRAAEIEKAYGIVLRDSGISG
jgi:glycosyltransferase involved in cell wall biosynthesis